jgi:hypothetical protein
MQRRWRNHVRTIVMASLLVVYATGTELIVAQSADAQLRAELIRLHTEWMAAFDKGDGAAMDGTEVPTLALVFPDGTSWRKSEPRAGKQKSDASIYSTPGSVTTTRGGRRSRAGRLCSTA